MIVSLFGCTPALLRSNPGLAAELRGAGVRHCEMQVCRPLRDEESQTSYEANWNREQGEELRWCVKNDRRVVARLDDAMRTPPEQEAMRRDLTKMTFIASRLGQSGICDKVEVCDEMNPDPRMYPVRDLADAWYSAGGPPLGFPSYSTWQYSRMKMGDRFIAGHHSCQWNWETAYTYEDRLARLKASISGLPNDERQVCVQIPVVKQYRKGTAGGDGTFRPGADRWLNRGMTGPGISNLVNDAIKLVGAERIQFRFYALDALWAIDRANAPAGARCQVGMGPGDERWAGFLQVLKRFTS